MFTLELLIYLNYIYGTYKHICMFNLLITLLERHQHTAKFGIQAKERILDGSIIEIGWS